MLIDGLVNLLSNQRRSFLWRFSEQVSKFGIYAYHDSTEKYITLKILTNATYDNPANFSKKILMKFLKVLIRNILVILNIKYYTKI